MDKELKNILKSSILLLVEDDIRIREKFTRLLEIYVNKIYEVSNGEDALKLYKKVKPSFIIADIEMPHMDGLKFIELLREEDEITPILVVSAHSNKEYLLTSIKLQLIDYLLKPVSHNDLIIGLEKVAKTLKKIAVNNVIEINNGVIYNPKDKTISVCNTINRLTINESKLLELLILNRGNIVTKQMVEEKLYIFKEMSDSALKNVVYKLRKKLIKDVIISVDRLGYKID